MVKKKIKIIKSGRLDKEGLKKIGKSFLLTLAAASLVFIGDLTNTVDFGGWGAIATVFVPFVVNVLRKFLGEYESK